MQLIAVRHGETEWNVQGREMGQLDSPLTKRGIQQAAALGERLRKLSVQGLYSSDLGRAVKTAEIVAAACQRQVNLDAGLRERHMGVFQGLTLEEMQQKYPRERADYERIGFCDIVPGGESAQQRQERSVRVLTSIAGRHSDETIVVVTHGGFLMGFFEFVLGIPAGNGWRFERHNASFSSFDYVRNTWRLRTWNDVGHLDRLVTPDDPPLMDG